ncbi:MAG: DUF4097 family beta strand repeat protein [Flavobacteriales bacterium]|nr:DUF4097 family beta strand repeat protein [Flavobacteriales bacterium]
MEEKGSYILGLPKKEEKEQNQSSNEEAISTEKEIPINSLSVLSEVRLIEPSLSSIEPMDQSEKIIKASEQNESILELEDSLVREEESSLVFDQTEPLESNLGGDFEGEVKTLTKSISADNISALYLNHSNGDINITAWDKNEIEVIATFTLKTSEPEDTKKGLDDFDVDLTITGSKLIIESNWDELNNCNCNQTSEPKRWMKFLYFPTKNKATTDDGESFEYENFKITYEVKIPKKMSIDVSNKYANVSVSDVDGDLSANLFRGSLIARNVSNNIDLIIKYGSVQIGDFLDGDVTLFRSDAAFGTSNRLDFKANYSTINYAGGKELNLTAFRSDLTSSGPIDEIEGSFKYGELKLKEHIIAADLELFRAKVEGKTFDKLNVDASYTEFNAEKAQEFDIENGFRCEFKFDEIAKVEGSLKYSPIKIGVLLELADINAFRGKIEIDQVNADFKQLNFETKYTDIDLSFNPEAKYELDAQTTYTDFKVPGEMMDISLQNGVNNNSNHFVGTFNKASSKSTSKVFVNSFQGVIRLD